MGAEGLLSFGCSHYKTSVWSLKNGEQGTNNKLELFSKTNQKMKAGFASGVRLHKGDEIQITTADGGGWGKANI